VEVRFLVTDTAKAIPVVYSGALPDLFREGKGVVAQGTLGADGVFRTVVGAIYSPVKCVDLDFGVKRGFQRPALGVALAFGLTLRW